MVDLRKCPSAVLMAMLAGQTLPPGLSRMEDEARKILWLRLSRGTATLGPLLDGMMLSNHMKCCARAAVQKHCHGQCNAENLKPEQVVTCFMIMGREVRGGKEIRK